MRSFLVFVLAIALFALPGFTQTCYLSNGKVAEQNGVKDKPCRPDDPHSTCCGTGRYACAANGLCSDDQSLFVVGSCTDPTWEDPACPDVCNAKFHINNSVIKCPQADTYCCGDGPACKCPSQTSAGVNTIKFLDTQPKYSVLIAAQSSSSTSSLSSTSSTTSSTLSSSSSTNTQTASIAPTSIPTTSIPPTSSQTTSVQSTASSNTAPPASSSNGLAIGLGAGLGAALFCSLAGVGAFLFWRKKKKEERANNGASTEGVPSYTYTDKTYAPPTPPVEVGSSDYTQNNYPPQQMIYEAPGTFTYPDHTPGKGGR